MRSLSLLFILSLFMGCSFSEHENRNSSDPYTQELIAQLSKEELKIHNCLKAAGNDLEQAKACVLGTAFEKQFERNPASQGPKNIMSMIASNSWLFDSPRKLNKIFKILKGMSKAQESLVSRSFKSLTHHHGISFSGQMFAGAGVGGLFEFINHNQKFGLFCAPYIMATTDMGVSTGVTAVRSISCKNNDDYRDGFFGFKAGVSGEAIGIPVDIGLAYSLGINISRLKKSIRLAKNKRQLNLRELAREIKSLGQRRPFDRTVANYQRKNSLFEIAVQGVQVVGVNASLYSRKIASLFRNAVSRNYSLGKSFKRLVKTQEMQKFFEDNRTPHLEKFLHILAGSLTGCDSVGGSASLSLSLSPVAAGVTLENFHLLGEFPADDVLAFTRIANPLLFLNPLLMKFSDMGALIRTAKTISRIPANQRHCRNFGL